ncbi:unnamed protein product (macronuclear) [Paramecium tetraurelia]|uniref:UBC core domain-containing protein n=1 Tax=Paramecium tetraurelia TaxID=5888 RepID=A0BYU9_PARTE|nr:uncharacterized protein GSPATT00033569001 [Paramecium tetraurelia]CAK63716.1 unnamed protein product [Paramecium tetraurelia]|eukprot:XP_001431114.1 hypothetical protein (macronuclear) [Paramecium tetraurelia strain d4-2]
MSQDEYEDYEEYYCGKEEQMEQEEDIEPALQRVESTTQTQQYVQIVDPNTRDDPAFVLLLQENNIPQLEVSLLSDFSMFFERQARLFNYCANLFQLAFTSQEIANDYVMQLSRILKLFFQIQEIGSYSQFQSQLAQHVGYSTHKIGYAINSDQQLVLLILKLILKDDDQLQQIQAYLPRFLMFTINPPQPFTSATSPRVFQTLIVNRINDELFDASFEKPNKLDILALSYFSQQTQNISIYKEIITILASIFESLLDQKQSQYLNHQLINLLHFFLAFTTNQTILHTFFNNHFHRTLYNSIRFSQPIFGSLNQPQWSKEPLIIDAMVNLIVRIVSIDQVDKILIEILQDDFTLLLEKQKFDFIYRVILPILNSEQVRLIPVCFHPRLSVQESKQQVEKFLLSQKKSISISQSLTTELLTKKQCEKINQLVIDQLKTNIPQMQQELGELQQIYQQSLEQNINPQMNKGSWVNLHQFNPYNPHLDSQILFDKLDNRNNVLFIFDLMAGNENVRLVCFINNIIQDKRQHNYIQAKSNSQSFYALMVQDDHFWYVNSLDKKPHVILDIQQSMLQIGHHNQPIACINFVDFQSCKFGFPFEKIQQRILLIDQITASMMEQDCYLIQIEIWTFDESKDQIAQTGIQDLLDHKSYTQQLNYYLSQFRFQTIHFIPHNLSVQELSTQLKEKINIEALKENEINDIIVNKPILQLHLKTQSQKPLLSYFQTYIGGIEKILEQINKHLYVVKADQVYKQLFIELHFLSEIDGFYYSIIQTDGFLQFLLAVAFLNDKKEGRDAYNKVIELMYQSLALILDQNPNLKEKALFTTKVQIRIVNRIDSYLNLLNRNVQSQFQFKLEPKKTANPKQQEIQKGKPKGIGYGDISYKNQIFDASKLQQEQQQSQQQSQYVPRKQIEIQQSQQEINLEALMSCLRILLDQDYKDSAVIQCLQQSHILNFLIKYFQTINITQLEGSKVFNEILKIVENLAKCKTTLKLFLINDNQSLFRQLETFNQWAIMFIKTFNSKVEELNEFMEIYDYVESCLYASNMITIQYLSQDQQNQNQEQISMHQFYRPFMKRLAVGKCEIKSDPEYLSVMKEYYQNTNNPNQIKMQKLISEISGIEENLPMESSNSIFLRYDQDRMDCMRTIIFGSSGTPYAHGAFLYDMYFGEDYPQRPPKMKLSTTGHGKVRFNPNLYNCGKVCLSLLGTWGDSWIVNFSTILQILISVQSMVMWENVMFNEPGWESQMGTSNGEQANRGYCNFVKVQNIKYAMIEQLQKPPKGFEEVIQKSFYLRKDLIKKEIESWIEQANLPATYGYTQNNCSYGSAPGVYKQELIKVYDELKVELEKLKFNIGADFYTITDEKKKAITINQNQFDQMEQDEINNMQMPQGLDMNEIDISYEDALQQRQFDSNDQNLQNLMSRYIGVVGLDAVKKQSESTIFIHGLNGLGLEIAKNIVLSGVKRLIIYDPTLVELSDLGTNFYLNQEDIDQRKDAKVLNKLKYLNPYVKIDVLQNSIQELNLDEIQVFITQDPKLSTEISKQNKVAVILAQTRNVFARIVTDFGNEFNIIDKDGEQLSEVLIESIQNNVVTLFKNQNHNLNENDVVLIQEVKQQEGQQESYNQKFQIRNVKRNSFELVTDKIFCNYISHGVAYQQKQVVKISFQRIQNVLSSFSYFCENMGMLDRIGEIKRALIHFCLNSTDQLNNDWNLDKIKLFINEILSQKVDERLNEHFNEDVYNNYRDELMPLQILLSINTQFQPLCAFIGGMAAQEAMKAINKKYTPIHQAYVQSFEDVLPFKLRELNNIQQEYQQFLQKYGIGKDTNSRYKDLINTIGGVQNLHSSNVFVVGAGAIGCELLKNYALLGVGKNGAIYVTDPDIIENSNLSRQFLFREKHIRKPKSLTAAAVVKSMNPDIKIIARLDKVCQETQDIYHNQFYKQMNCVTNALDNVQARLYIDSKCVENDICLIESGTLGTKGHVQTIIPNLTESYASKQDPEQNNDIPYCTLRMFPENNIHCLEWARDKFEQYFYRKPTALVQLMQEASPQQQTVDLALRILKKYPKSFQQCLELGRQKFQKLFVFDIQALLNAYPLDSVNKEGKLFWSPPKRAPQVIEFQGAFAYKFVEYFAILTAQIYGIQIPQQYDLTKINVEVLSKQQLKKNKIQDLAEKQQNNQIEQEEEVKNYNQLLDEARNLLKQIEPSLPQPQQFEKDDDLNHHVSFITSATNGRALNYGIQQVDWMWTKLKAGRIIPAMATTTSCIAGLQTLELIKILQKGHNYRNTFLNLAIPFLMQSEPGEVEKKTLANGMEITIWSKHQLKICKYMEPLSGIIRKLENRFNTQIISIQQGAKVIYLSQMLPKDELELYELMNAPISSYVQFVNRESQINVQLKGCSWVVVILTMN